MAEMGLEGEVVLYRLRELTPIYCQYLGAIATTCLSRETHWREVYNQELYRVGTEIQRTAQDIPDLEPRYLTPDEVLEKFLHGMFNEAVSMRYKFEKGNYDKRNNPV